MPTSMSIADAHYLWSEVDRLKAQVAQLQLTDKRVVEDQSYIRDYVASFVTHAQLDAALCTKISQVNVSASVDKLRAEMFECLAAKADSEIAQSLQSKKLDVSVYESAVWDVKKYRAALEQNMHDLFAAFAHQIEAQVNSKVSIEDFNLIFNPEAYGQKQAIENAATRISRMKDQLESLQEYVNADRQRQHKIADLNVGMLDLTRKHNASRNALAQLMSSVDTTKQEITELETSRDRFASEVAAIAEELQTFKAHIEADRESKEEKQAKIMHDVHELQSMSSKMVQSLEQIQQFTHDTLLKTMDTKLMQLSNNFHRGLDDLSASQRQYAQLVTAQLGKSNVKQQYQIEQMSLLESRIRKLGAHLHDVSDQLNLVKGPLATLATNLREENVTILQEIQRSQNESRDIMLDYQELLEKEQQLPTSGIPSRPSSCASARVSSAYASRKHKHQALSMGKNTPRPQTSNTIVKTSTPTKSTQSPNNNSNDATTASRAQTAGSIRNKSKLPPQKIAADNNLVAIDTSRILKLRGTRNTSLLTNYDDEKHEASGSEPMFHFPPGMPTIGDESKIGDSSQTVLSSNQVPQTY